MKFSEGVRAVLVAGGAWGACMSSQAEVTAVPYGGIIASHSGKCLAIEGASGAAGARVVQAACDDSDDKQFWLQARGAGFYSVVNRGSNQCLVVSQGSNVSKAQVVQESCTAAAATQWQLTSQGAGGYALKAKHSGMCLDVYGQDRASGASLIQYPCSGSANQTFQFERPVFGEQTAAALMSRQSGLCVDISGGSMASTAEAIQFGCHGRTSQQWKLQALSDNTVRVVSGSTGMCLDVSGNSRSPGGKVIQYGCHAGANQQWRLQAAAENAWRLVSVNSGMCLDLEAASMNPGAKLVQSVCAAGAKSQLWTLHSPTLRAKWSDVVATSVDAVAAANLPDGRILSWAANDRISYNGPGGKTYTEILDPVARTASTYLVAETGHDMFCPGTGMLPDGRIFVNGGTDDRRTSIYDPATGRWSTAAPMSIGRGYQGSVVNPDGSVFTLGGSWSGGWGNKTGELWNERTGWSLRPGVPPTNVLTGDQQGIFRADNHLWLQVLSGGRLLHAGPSKQMNWIDVGATGGPGNITPAGLRGDDTDSMNGNLVPYLPDLMLKIGGSPNYGDNNANATRSAQIIDARKSGLSVERIAPMAYARAFHNSVVLPNGQVVVVGGQTFAKPFSDDNAILVPEIWNPETRVFERLPAMATPRNYHSVALLMPDGRVWSAGGGLCGGCSTNHLNYEVLTPPYLLNADGTAAARPSIIAVGSPSAAVGGAIAATVSEPVSRFALVRLASVTHSLNNDQRRIALTAESQNGRDYVLRLPGDAGVVVPGYYMLFALNAKGVPSVAQTVRIAAR